MRHWNEFNKKLWVCTLYALFDLNTELTSKEKTILRIEVGRN